MFNSRFVFSILIVTALSAPALGQIGSIDAPSFQAVVSSVSTFSGWAADSSAPVSDVLIKVDGASYGSTTYGTRRVDACNAIGNYPGCPNVGWYTNFNTASLTDGPHMLQVTIQATNGQQSTIMQPLIVDNANQGLDSDTYYQIVSRATGGVIDVAGASIANGAAVQEWQYLGGVNQLWLVVPTQDGNWVFQSLNSSKALSIPASGVGNGSPVEQMLDFGTEATEWRLVGAGASSYAFFNVLTGLSLDLQNGSSTNGTRIQIYTYNGTTNQNWLLVPVMNPPSGLFGTEGSTGSTTAPQIPVSDILFPTRIPVAQTSFAPQPANGPACENASELLNLPLRQTPLSPDNFIHVPYAYTSQNGIRLVKPVAAVKTDFDYAFNQWDMYTTTTFVSFAPLSSGQPATAALVDVVWVTIIRPVIVRCTKTSTIQFITIIFMKTWPRRTLMLPLRTFQRQKHPMK